MFGVADWVSIKAEYIAGGITLHDLAEKHGVSYASLRKRAAAEQWKSTRTNTEQKVNKKVQVAVVHRVANREIDRLTRILAVSDALLQKAERGVSELGEYFIVKRKVSRSEPVKNEKGEVIGYADVDETAEIATKGAAIVPSASVKQLASALKDLHEIAKGNEQEGGKDVEDLSPLATLLGDPHE